MEKTAFDKFCNLQDIRPAETGPYSETEYAVAVLAWNAALEAASEIMVYDGYSNTIFDQLKTGEE